MSENKNATGEHDYKGFAIVGEPGPEPYTLPADASIYPNYHQQQETLWQIAQAVAEYDSTYVDSNGFLRCPFCGELHAEYCIVTKARELIEWRKAQPKITIHVKNDFSPAVSPIAEIARELAEKFKKKE